MYPFRRESLVDTLRILEGLQTNLHTSFLALQIHDTSILAKQTEMIQTVQDVGVAMLTKMQQYEASLSEMTLTIENLSVTPQWQQTFHGGHPLRDLSRCLALPIKQSCFCPKVGGGFRLHRSACPLYNRSMYDNSRLKRIIVH
ncbi:hypothetical protein BJY00DRAFT_38951 [Aspergillus carlsbadensis]|nr:hypothetical protein BJY00DRAFT_38951 [Aspergillus carlsbadensis]